DGASDGSLDVLDAVDPHGEDWREVVRQGVTAVYVQPGNSGILGGKGAVLRVGPAEAVVDLLIKPAAAMQAALGTMTAPAATPAALPTFGRRGGPPIIAPATPAPAASISNNSLTRYAQYEQLKRALEAAKQQGSKPDAAKVFLGKVLKGEIALRIEAHREDDVRNALHLADELKLRIVLDGLTNPRA